MSVAFQVGDGIDSWGWRERKSAQCCDWVEAARKDAWLLASYFLPAGHALGPPAGLFPEPRHEPPYPGAEVPATKGDPASKRDGDQPSPPPEARRGRYSPPTGHSGP